MTLTYTFADTEGAVRTWLRSIDEVTAFVDDRVFFAVPARVAFPLLTVRLVGGGPVAGDLPMSSDLLQIDCWGEGTNKAEAALLKNVVIGAIESVESGTAMGDDAVALWATTASVIWLPDPETNQARYAITADFSVTAR